MDSDVCDSCIGPNHSHTLRFCCVLKPCTGRLDCHFSFMVNDQLDAQFFSMYLLQFSTCFEQPRAHHQENQLYQYNLWYIQVSQEECEILRECVPYVKLYRYNPKHLYPKLNGYGDNGQRKMWTSCISAFYTPTALSRATHLVVT